MCNNVLPACASGAAEQTQHCELTPCASFTLEWCGLKDKDKSRQKGPNLQNSSGFPQSGLGRMELRPDQQIL